MIRLDEFHRILATDIYESILFIIDKNLAYSEMLFFKGDYKKSLDVSLKSVSIVDDKIYKKVEGMKNE